MKTRIGKLLEELGLLEWTVDPSSENHPLHKILTINGFKPHHSFEKGGSMTHAYDKAGSTSRVFIHNGNKKWSVVDKGGSRTSEKNPEGEGEESLRKWTK